MSAPEKPFELDPEIANIVVNGCPMGHSDKQMTVGEMYADPQLREVLEDPLKNISVMEAAQLPRQQAIGIALGGFALKDERGELVRRLSTEPAAAEVTHSPAGESEKK